MSTDLNTLMSIDHVIRVHPDGTITEPRDVFAPDVYADVDADGQCLPGSDADMIETLRTAGWELMNGYSSQDRYAGPIMHPSEAVGGGMERDIRANPGLYVACAVSYLGESEEADDGDGGGWVLAYRHDQ